MARNKRNFGVNKVANFGEVKALREEHNKLVEEVDELKTKLAATTTALLEVKATLATTVTALLELKTKQGAHTHTGVTTGTDVSGAASTITYAATAPSATFAAPAPTATFTSAQASEVV